MRPILKFDNPLFNKNEISEYLKTDARLMRLASSIMKLPSGYKHVIYAKDVSYAKIVCSILILLGYEHCYDSNHNYKHNNITQRRFAYLSQSNVYQKPLSRKLVKEIKKIYNARPSNIYGKDIQIVVIDHHFKEGIDFFDVRYLHIYSDLRSTQDEKQIVGRAKRMCGHIGLYPDTKLYVYNYFTQPLQDNTLANELTKICYYASVDFPTDDINSAQEIAKNLFIGDIFDTIKSNISEEDDIYSRYKKVQLGGDNFKQFRKEISLFAMKYKQLNTVNDMKTLCTSNTFNMSYTQKFIKDYFTPTNSAKGMLLWHSAGSGKTCTGLGVARTFADKGYTIIWVTKASLLQDIKKNLMDCYGKDTIDRKRWLVPMSYRTFTNMLQRNNKYYEELVSKNKTDLRKTLLIIDEAHKLFDNSLSRQERPDINTLKHIIRLQSSCRLLLMTATPFMKNHMDLIKLLNLILPDSNILPTNFEQFSNTFLMKDNIHFTEEGAKMFIEIVHRHISYLDISSDITKFAQEIKISV